MDFNEILAKYMPVTLTEAARLIRTDEPFVLTTNLGRNAVNAVDETCVFEVEEGVYHLAPIGYPNDPATNVNIARKRKPYAVTPPQIFMKDMITAREINNARVIGMNPINMNRADKSAAFNELIAIKQQGLTRLIERRTEWLFAKALEGKINYTSESGRAFEFDYKFPNAASINNEWWNNATNPGNPLHHLRALGKYFRQLNNQLAPDMIILGGAAGDAFINNPHIEEWMKSAGVQLFQLQAPLAKGDAQPLGNLQGARIYEYSGTYENEKGKAVPYVDESCVYLTNSTLWRLYYGAIADFDAGNPPLVQGSRFSKMKISEDGKALNIFMESHPLPVVISNLAVVRAKVVD